MKKFFAILLSLIILTLSSGSVYAKKKTPEQKREMQTHYFDTGNSGRVMMAAINTLQDSGFVIEEIDTSLGYLRAKKTFKEKFSSKKRVLGWSTVLAATTAYTVFSYGTTVGTMINPTRRVMYELRDKTVIVDANVNVEQISENKTKVRFVFAEKVLQNADGFSFTQQAPIKVIRINKPKVYDEFFAQISEKL